MVSLRLTSDSVHQHYRFGTNTIVNLKCADYIIIVKQNNK